MACRSLLDPQISPIPPQKVALKSVSRIFNDQDYFSHELSLEIRRLHPEEPSLDFVFISHAGGQSCPIEYFSPNFWRLNENCLTEVLYHLAYDNEQVGSYLLWDRSALVKIFGPPNHEYFPNLIGNFGNYYFKNHQPDDEIYCVSTIKFYGAAHKFVHDSPELPFKGPNASAIFLSAATGEYSSLTARQYTRLASKCRRIELDLQLLGKLAGSFETSTTGDARVEFIVSSKVFSSVATIDEICRRQIEELRLVNGDTLKSIAPSTLRLRCVAVFDPFRNFVTRHLVRFRDAHYQTLEISPRQILTCLAGEALVAMMIYGSSVRTPQTEGFPQELCKDVGAVTRVFSRVGPEVFPEIGNGAMFVDEDAAFVYCPRFNYKVVFPLLDFQSRFFFRRGFKSFPFPRKV